MTPAASLESLSPEGSMIVLEDAILLSFVEYLLAYKLYRM